LKAFLPVAQQSAPAIRPCDTPNGSDTLRHLTADHIYKLFGNRRFRNYSNFCLASKDSKFVNGGDPVPTLGEFATIPKRKRGSQLPRPSRALDRVHIDIVFGDGIGRLGYRYALLFVDRATRYIWVYGLKSLHAEAIISAFSTFRAEAGGLAVQFRTDCDAKLLSQAVVKWLRDHGSDIASAPAGRQSSNGLVERQWRTMLEMARSYLTEKQMPRAFWLSAIQHAARMMNCIPGKVGNFLTTPFELIHHSPPDSRVWFPLFSVGYFNHTRDGSVVRSSFQAQTMEGIAIGRSDTSNAMIFYNPRTRQYYEPDSYKLDPSRLPSTVWPSDITYDGGIFADLYRDSNPNVPEHFPPGTRVQVVLPNSSSPTLGTISTIPLKTTTGAVDDGTYMVLLDEGKLIPVASTQLNLFDDNAPVSSDLSPSADTAIPSFLCNGSKVTLAKGGHYHKGFLLHLPHGGFRFTVRHRLSSKREEWGVDLPSFPAEWPILCSENRLIPSWVVPSFAHPPLTDPPFMVIPSASATSHHHKPLISIPSFQGISSTMPVVLDINVIGSASHVSAQPLVNPCPPSLQKALDPSNVDRKIWLSSYSEEKASLKDVETFEVIDLAQYRKLRSEGAPRAIPSMCVLVIKLDEHGQPDRAKSRIVVLGNQEGRSWGKHERAAPVLKYSSLRLMASAAVEHHRKLKQADYKNAFCNPTLPRDEITIIRPPLGDPDAKEGEYWLLKKTLYGLQRSPKHWYDMVTRALLDMGLQQSSHDPCLFHGFPSTEDYPASPGDEPLTIGLYVDDMVYYSVTDAVERRFEEILAAKFKISFMGVVNWFLGTHFTWLDLPDGEISVHMSQVAFAQNLVERHRQQHINVNPRATPYRSGLPIDSIPGAPIEDFDDPTFLRRREMYQSIVGSLNWLATNTRPDLAPITSFLAAYNNNPSQGHVDAALYAIKYLRQTVDYGIAFHSKAPSATSGFIHFPFHHDLEAYSDALPPTAAEQQDLTAYSDACWGSQLGGAVTVGEEIDMFKLRSMSGFIVIRAGGPIAWSSVRQERTSRSSCEAEVRATDECAKEILSIRHRGQDIGLDDTTSPTKLFNDNQACVDWCKTTTTSGMKHINLRDNAVRESVHLKDISIHHIPGKVNCADIFTKELKDASHFCLLRDSFMLKRSQFESLLG
jgi:transposase InsO family protein